MRRFFAFLTMVALFGLLPPATFTLAQAETYSITVPTDETTDGDLSLIETFLATANDGDLISQSLRRLIMAAVGEFWLLVDGRTDASSNLTLDDGTVQPLADGDVIAAKKKFGGALVIFTCSPPQPTAGPCRGRPVAISVCNPSVKCRTVELPGGKVGPK